MANNFLDVTWFSMEVLRILKNSLEIASVFNTDWQKDYEKEFPVGSVINVKYPQRWLIRNGLGYSPQAINRISTPVSLDNIFGVDFEWDDYEAAVKLERSEDEIRAQYLEPAAVQLAQEVDSRAANWATINTPNVFGALGTDPTTVNTYLNAERRLYELACPKGDRIMCVSPRMQADFAANQTTLFNPSSEIARMYKTGLTGTAAGWEWYRSNSLYSVTAGTSASGFTVSGAGQSGSSLTIAGTNGDTINAGDKFSIANVNQVNPVTRRSIGGNQVKNFTVLQSYTLSGSTATIAISPSIYGPGSQYQNVDSLPANSAALTMWPGTASPNGATGTVGLGLTKFAYALVGAKFYVPNAVEHATQTQDPKTGLAIRFVRAWDPVRSMQVTRFDMCIGFGNLYNDNGAVVVVGQ